MTQANSVLSTPRITASKPNPPDQPITGDDELGMALVERAERATAGEVVGHRRQ
jgi:hypothetical protein